MFGFDAQCCLFEVLKVDSDLEIGLQQVYQGVPLG